MEEDFSWGVVGKEEFEDLDKALEESAESVWEKIEKKEKKIKQLKGKLERKERKEKKIKKERDKFKEKLEGKEKELQKTEKGKEEIKEVKEELGEKKKENQELKVQVKRLKNDIPILEELKKKEEKKLKDFEDLSEDKKKKMIKERLRKMGFPGDLDGVLDQYALRNLLHLTGLTKQFPSRSDIISELKTFILLYNTKIWRETTKQDKEKYRKKYDYKIEVPGNKEFSSFFLQQLEEEVLTKGFRISVEKALDLVPKIYKKDNYYFQETRYGDRPNKLDKKEEKKRELVKFLRDLKRELILKLEAEEEKGTLGEEEKKGEEKIKIEKPKEIEDLDYKIPSEKWNKLSEQERKIFRIIEEEKSFDSQNEYRKTFNRRTKWNLKKTRFSEILNSTIDQLRFKKRGKLFEPIKEVEKGRSKSYRLG